MAYFQQYQTSPGWGTNQYQAMPPPAPSWQPQPGWGGMDYYRAYAGVADPFPYEYALNRVRNYRAEGGGGGTAGLVEAKMLHRQVYGGLGDIMAMPPNAIGAAAAYEVFRTWRYHYGIIARPLGGDRERQREALIGLAVGEAIRLWEYTHRFSDQAGRLATVESAAITATQIFAQAQQMALVSEGIVGAGSVNGRGAESEMSTSGGGGYVGGMGAGGLSGGARMPGAGGMTSVGSGFPTPMGGSAGGMGVPGGVGEVGVGAGMGGPAMDNGAYGAGGLAPPFRRQRSLSMGAATGLPGPMRMTNGIPPGIVGGAGYSRQGATAGGLGSGVAGGMGAAGMGAAGMGGMGAGGMGMGGMGAGEMQYAASQGSLPGGAGGGGGAYGGGGLGITGLQRSRSYNTLNSGAGYPTEYTGGAGYGGGVGGGGMYGGGGGGPGGYGGGGYGGMNGGSAEMNGGSAGMYGGRGYGGIGTTNGMGLAGAVNGSYGAPAAAYAQGNLSPTGALGEEAIAHHERRREKRSNSGERRPRRRRHKHGEGRTETTEGYRGSNEGYGDNAGHGGGGLGCSAF